MASVTFEKKGKFIFVHNGSTYKIDNTKPNRSIGDIDERKKIIFLDKHMPAQFMEGIALHEIVERQFIRKGHSYEYSHNQAQKAELKFYQKKHGLKKGKQMLFDEEKYVLKFFDQNVKEESKNLSPIRKDFDVR